MHYFTFDNVPSTDYGVYVTASNIFDSAEEDVETIEIPYSNNVVHLSKGSFKPFVIKNECLIYDSASTRLESFRNFLQSRGKACRYVDSLKTDEFRIARFKRAFEVRRTDYSDIAVFGLELEARPQRFLTSGETPISITGSEDISNPTSFSSKPLIKTIGWGTIYVNGYEITVHDPEIDDPSVDGVYVDCETMQCYFLFYNPLTQWIQNANSYCELPQGFPVLGPGDNNIDCVDLSGGGAVITPRWWKL